MHGKDSNGGTHDVANIHDAGTGPSSRSSRAKAAADGRPVSPTFQRRDMSGQEQGNIKDPDCPHTLDTAPPESCFAERDQKSGTNM